MYITWLLLLALVMPFSVFPPLLMLLTAVKAAWHHAWRLDLVHILMIGWLLWPLTSLTWSMSPGLSIHWLGALLCLPLAWLIAIRLHNTGMLLPRLRSTLPILLAVAIAWGLIQGPNTYTGKPQGPFNDPNTYAATLNLLALPILVAYLSTNSLGPRQYTRRIIHLGMSGAFFFMQGLIASRGATLAFVVVIIPMLYAMRKLPGFKLRAATVTVIAIAANLCAAWVLSVYSHAPTIVGRVTQTLQTGDHTRLLLYKAAWDMVKDYPLLGTGLGSFRLRYPSYRHPDETGSAGGWAHNDYLQLWVEAGAPMVLMLLALVIWLFYHLLHSHINRDEGHIERLGYGASILTALIHAAFNFIIYYSPVSMLLGLYLATLHPNNSRINEPGPLHARPTKMAIIGYSMASVMLLAGQTTVDTLLGQASRLQQYLMRYNIIYPKYDIAWILTIVAPWNPTPQHVMGQVLLEMSALSGDPSITSAALYRLNKSIELTPCYQPYYNSFLKAVASNDQSGAWRHEAIVIANKSIACNPRHALTYYYLGLIDRKYSEQWWKLGLTNTPHNMIQRLLLVAATASLNDKHYQYMRDIADRIAEEIYKHEADPNKRVDTAAWLEFQLRLTNTAR